MRRPFLSALALMALSFAATTVLAQRGAALPAWLTLPPETIVPPNPEARVVREAYGEAEFPKDAGGVLRGEHWNLALRYPAAATGVPKPTGKEVFAKLAPALDNGGWAIVKAYDRNPFAVVLRRQADGRDAWLRLDIFGPTDIRGDLVSVGAQPMVFRLEPPRSPAPKFETATGDFPDLPPLPGSQYRGGRRADQPMRVDLVSADGKRENAMVASSSTTKIYVLPDLSNLQFASVYRAAMEGAGWTIVSQQQGLHQGDAVLVAHFGKDGRNLWAYLRSQGGEYSLQLGEDAADDLSREFAKSCHVALYGVVFDFDKASLRTESDAALTRALGLFKAAGGAGIEVQGHTDNVGGDDYNQKLSEARAATVAAWFTGHGVPAAQLVSRGYGKSRPVADNGAPEGRAKNRRVEIARADCRR